MLRPALHFALAAAFLFSAMDGAFADGQTLEGWGGFKFGMRPELARAVPSFEFGRYSAKNIIDQNQGAMAARKPAIVNGVPYSLDLWFNAFEALYEVNLQNEKTTGRADCEAAFLTLLSQTEKTYGELAPVYAEHKKNDQDELPVSIAWKKSAGKSRYQLATAYLGVETASVWNARRSFGERYVDIAAVWSAGDDTAQAVCLTQIDYHA